MKLLASMLCIWREEYLYPIFGKLHSALWLSNPDGHHLRSLPPSFPSFKVVWVWLPLTSFPAVGLKEMRRQVFGCHPIIGSSAHLVILYYQALSLKP